MSPIVNVCPVEPGTALVRGARLGQFLLVGVIAAAAATHGLARSSLILFLGLDLIIKAFGAMRYAPLALCARSLLRLFASSTKHQTPQNIGPKRFAARVGLSFVVLMAICHLMQFSVAYFIVAVVFGGAALLDASTGLCIACILYSYWHGARQ